MKFSKISVKLLKLKILENMKKINKKSLQKLTKRDWNLLHNSQNYLASTFYNINNYNDNNNNNNNKNLLCIT